MELFGDGFIFLQHLGLLRSRVEKLGKSIRLVAVLFISSSWLLQNYHMTIDEQRLDGTEGISTVVNI